MPGGIPTISAIDQPKYLLKTFKTDSSASTLSSTKFAEIITRSILFGPNNAYFRFDGRGISSTIGDSSMDGFDGGDSLLLKSRSSFFSVKLYDPSFAKH